MTHPASLVMMRVGRHEYPARYVPECLTCTSPFRHQIEADVVGGRTYAAIVRMLPPAQGDAPPNPSVDSIRNHFTGGHMPIQAEMRRRLIETRARQVGKSIEDAAETLVDQYTLAQTVVHRTFERLASGEIEPDLSDGLAAAKFVQQVEAEMESGLDQEVWVNAMQHLLTTAERYMPHDRWQAFGQEMMASPVIKALREQREREAQRKEQQALTMTIPVD